MGDNHGARERHVKVQDAASPRTALRCGTRRWYPAGQGEEWRYRRGPRDHRCIRGADESSNLCRRAGRPWGLAMLRPEDNAPRRDGTGSGWMVDWRGRRSCLPASAMRQARRTSVSARVSHPGRRRERSDAQHNNCEGRCGLAAPARYLFARSQAGQPRWMLAFVGALPTRPAPIRLGTNPRALGLLRAPPALALSSSYQPTAAFYERRPPQITRRALTVT